jgi:hypothetical protein
MPSTEWMAALAAPEEAQLIARVADMRRVLERAVAAGKNDKTQGIEDRLARVEGLVFWQIADDSSGRVRKLARASRANKELLADIDSRVVRVETAEHNFAVGVQTDFFTFQTRADSIASAVTKAKATREGMLSAQLRSGIRKERAQVEKYLLLTRIAIARAMDQIAMNGDASDAAIATIPEATP